MIEIAAGDSLVVRVAPYTEAATAGEVAAIAVGVADPALAGALTSAIAGAITDVLAGTLGGDAPEPPTVRLGSRKALARDPGRLAGAIAIVPVTARNARHLVALVDGIRAAGAAGVQLVWDGVSPPRADVERHVFTVLERARATPGEPPVVLATSDPPVAALHLLVAHRSQISQPEAPR